jgi:hypothetical protein
VLGVLMVFVVFVVRVCSLLQRIQRAAPHEAVVARHVMPGGGAAKADALVLALVIE